MGEKILSVDHINRSSSSYRRKLIPVDTGSKNVIEWILHSGVKEKFTEITISFDELKNSTFIKFENNGRNQDLLTPEVLNRLSSLDTQQYYPAIGFRHADGRIEILDGSCRRAYVLNRDGLIKEFRLLLAENEITTLDAKALAKDIRSSLEQNLYEIGEQAKALKDAGMVHIEISKELGVSTRKISYGIRTQVIPLSVIKLFPVVNELTWQDYKLLIAIAPSLPDKILLSSQDLDVAEILEELTKLSLAGQEGEQVKAVPMPNKSKTTKTPLLTFEKGSRRKAQKVSSTSSVKYIFDRLGSKANEIIELKIAEALEIIKSQQVGEDEEEVESISED